MKKFILLFFLFSKLTFSQELVNSIDINLDKIKSFYRIEDPNNNEYALILKNKEITEDLSIKNNRVKITHQQQQQQEQNSIQTS